MNTHTTEQLLMCEKGDLVKYIQELKSENSYLTDWNIEKLNDNYVPISAYMEVSADLIDIKQEVEKEVKRIKREIEEFKKRGEEQRERADFNEKKIEELKGEFKILTDFIPCNREGNDPTAQDIVDYICSLYIHEDRAIKLEKEIKELKKRGEESLQLTMSQNEKFMDELEEKNKVMDTLKEQHRLELVKLKNANQLYKGYACGILEQQIQDDLCEICMGEIDIRLTNWLSKFLQEKFYEEIVPELINEITDDGMYSFGGYDDTYEIEDLGSGRISITHIERSSSDDEVDSSDDDE